MLIRCRPEGMGCDAALRIMARKIFFFFAVGRKPSFAQLVFNLSTVSVPVCLFRLTLVRCCMGVIVTSISKLMRIGRWSEPRFVYVCQLVEVIREVDANEISGKLGLALTGNLVGGSLFRILKLESDIMLSNICLSNLKNLNITSDEH